VTIVACGVLVARSIEAAEQLRNEGLSASRQQFLVKWFDCVDFDDACAEPFVAQLLGGFDRSSDQHSAGNDCHVITVH
jgi:hypothetical protein